MGAIAEPWASLVLFLASGAAIAMAAAATMMLRDLLRSSARIRALESELERVGDLVWDLRESEERSRTLVDGQGDLLVRRDATGRITFANDAFAALAGHPRDGLIGTTLSFDILERGEPQKTDAGVIRRDEAIATAAGPRWIEWQDVAVRGAPRGAAETLSVGRDVTARREAERAAARARDEAEAANRAKSRFLATVSHEIRTPLSGALGMAALLADTPLSPEQKSYVDAIRGSGEALLSLIDDILDFSKIEAGRLDLDARPFDMRALVEHVVELMGPRAHARGLDIAASVAADVPVSLLGDAARLKQVVLNLVGNAIKFTTEGGVALRVAPVGGAIELSVADTGAGIAECDAARMFEEFEQGDQSPARRHEGVGLGLAISRRIVVRMGGTIDLDSRVGEGTTFRVRLPLPAIEAEGTGRAPALGRKVLIASASPVTGRALAAMLGDLGASATVVTAPDATDAIRAGGFDVALVDRAMGLAAAGDILAGAAAAGLRAIAMVTPAERGELARLASRGAAGWLIKPVRAASLLAQIAAPRREAMPANDAVAPDATRPLDGLRVLLAEDNDVNGHVARTVLTRAGAEVCWARDGAEAVARFAERRFDAVLMDMRMPGLDGLEATRRIRASEMPGRRVPIHALTANAASEDLAACLAAGMDSAATKPLDRGQLIALLRPALPQRLSA